MLHTMAATGRVNMLQSGSFPKPLTEAEELSYLVRMKNGDEEARNILVEHNLRLVAHIVKKYGDAGENDDLISIGTIGLIKGIDSYNTEKKTRLATYAARCVENEILMHLRKIAGQRAEVSFDEPLSSDCAADLAVVKFRPILISSMTSGPLMRSRSLTSMSLLTATIAIMAR